MDVSVCVRVCVCVHVCVCVCVHMHAISLQSLVFLVYCFIVSLPLILLVVLSWTPPCLLLLPSISGEEQTDQLLADIDNMLADLNTHLDIMIPGGDTSNV